MKTLDQFECICLRERGSDLETQEGIQKILPNAQFVPVAKKPLIIEVLQALKGAFVLVIPAFVTPLETLATISPDPVLMKAGYRLAWLSRNAVTGEITDQTGPELWRRSDFLALQMEEKKPKSIGRIVMPACEAKWQFNTSSGAAFKAGVNHVETLRQAGLGTVALKNRLSIAAMVGQDAEHSDWWQLGVLRAILDADDHHRAYHDEKDLTTEPGAMRQRLDDLYREVRAECNLNVRYMSSKTSLFYKKNKFLMPQRTIYEAIANAYEALGPAGKILSKRYSEAGDWVWGGV